MGLRETQQKYGIRFKKGLGQNLLLDDNINRIMADAVALTDEDDVIEVGPGLGALTTRLQPDARRVLAVEIDKSFMPCLEDMFGDKDNMRLFRGDILNHDIEKLVEEFLPDSRSLKMASNLPYYITTPILFHFWEAPIRISRMVIMVQEEVALRLVAPVGARNYGRLALVAKYYSEVDIVHKVPRTCFLPQPKVDSCIVRLRNREEPLYPDVDKELLTGVMRSAFSQRRKTLRNSLIKSPDAVASAEILEAAMVAAGIDPGRRAQTVSLDEFAALAREIAGRL